MSQALVARISRVVDRRASRRGFLSRSALGATALAVAPVSYALRPTTAHAAICGCNGTMCECHNGCCDGYTDFCCKTSGENLCPPGTIVAGWWKADGSGFCDINGQPRPRYYLDCNLLCDTGCGCGNSGICPSACTDSDCRCLDGCHSRAVDCTRFRYGQCNQHVECVGEIACRIVTCVPPWEWDPSCTSVPATDNVTAFHDRPCLHVGFTDVSPRAFYTNAVGWMIDNRISTGLNDDLFGPQEPALRSHFATFLWRYVGAPPVAPSTQFNDVAPDIWYAGAVAWMVANRFTTGTGEQKFSPDAVLSRGEAITFLWRLAGSPEVSPTHEFTDVASDDFFASAVSWAASLGITEGVGNHRFGGGQDVTRAQAATFLYRYDLALGDRGAGS